MASWYIKCIEGIAKTCKAHGYRVSSSHCERLIHLIESCKDPRPSMQDIALIVPAITTLRDSFMIECDSERYLRVPAHRAEYYLTKLFSDNAMAVFGDAHFDMMEAGTCLALSRYTASVFHLMRVIDTGIRRVYERIGFDWTTNPSWDAMLKKIAGYITRLDKERDALDANWRSSKEQLQNIHARIATVKDIWRNATMHPDKRYTEDEATEIFKSTVGLMNEIAEFLS
jgi:hypothetical protein